MVVISKSKLFFVILILLAITSVKYKTLLAVPGGIPGVCDSIARITKVADLSFGAMLVDYAGTLTVDTNDGATTTGGVSRFSSVIRSSRFQVTGCPDSAYTIILPDLSTISSTTASMNVDRFVSTPTVGLLDPNGNQEVSVGARLNISSSQMPGDYSGSFVMEVAFQ